MPGPTGKTHLLVIPMDADGFDLVEAERLKDELLAEVPDTWFICVIAGLRGDATVIPLDP